MPPCLTPFSMWKGLVALLFSNRQLVSELHISPSMATVSGSMPVSLIVSYRVLRLIESKAFLRSISQQYSGLPLYFAISAIVSSMNIQSWQAFPGLKPACSSDRMLAVSMSFSIRSFTIRSSTLYHMFKREIGLQSSGLLFGGDVLGIRTTLACFIACGTYPSDQTL